MDEKRTLQKVDLDLSRVDSVTRLEELRRGREPSDIPLTDEYWKSLRKHRIAHQKESFK